MRRTFDGPTRNRLKGTGYTFTKSGCRSSTPLPLHESPLAVDALGNFGGIRLTFCKLLFSKRLPTKQPRWGRKKLTNGTLVVGFEPLSVLRQLLLRGALFYIELCTALEDRGVGNPTYHKRFGFLVRLGNGIKFWSAALIGVGYDPSGILFSGSHTVTLKMQVCCQLNRHRYAQEFHPQRTSHWNSLPIFYHHKRARAR